jgi:hypothetical protein
MNQDEKDLEKERLELERQKLELEREKFELEKNKTQNPSPKSNGGTTIGDIVGYICSIVLIVAVFLLLKLLQMDFKQVTVLLLFFVLYLRLF